MLADTPYEVQTPLAVTLPSTTATALKRQGWPSIMADVRREGHLLITNHNLPEAVILPPEEYDRLVNAARKSKDASSLRIEALKRKFAERLACLQEPGANEKLDTAMLKPLELRGQVLAGQGYAW